MSKINDLIKELCPNGVEYVSLGNIAILSSGEFVRKDKQVAVGYPVYNGGSSNTGYYSEYNTEANKIIMSARGAAGFVNIIKERFWAGNSCHVIDVQDERANWQFVYYCLKNQQESIIGERAEGTIPSVSQKQLKGIMIPIPPLGVQKEIVRILDKFGELEVELKDELKARNSQYEFWREKLLKNDKIENINLGSLCKVITKGTTPKKYAEIGVNFIKTESFRGDYVDRNKLSFVDNDTHSGFLKRSILEENDILFTIAGATIGKMTVVTKDLLPANTNQALAIIRLKDGVNLNHIKYTLQSNYMKEYIKLCVKGSAQPNLNLQQLNNFKFPYPSLEDQEKIVNVLDNFDRLINDITEGLPAEIELRRQQYEYYRNKLLSFEEI